MRAKIPVFCKKLLKTRIKRYIGGINLLFLFIVSAAIRSDPLDGWQALTSLAILFFAAALEKAEEATEAKQNFFSKMSHDIRTPLNVVLGMTQIVQV